MWKWIGNPLPTSETSLTTNQHPHYLFTGIYFVECQVPGCSRRYTFYVTAFYWRQWPRNRSLVARVEFNVTVHMKLVEILLFSLSMWFTIFLPVHLSFLVRAFEMEVFYITSLICRTVRRASLLSRYVLESTKLAFVVRGISLCFRLIHHISMRHFSPHTLALYCNLFSCSISVYCLLKIVALKLQLVLSCILRPYTSNNLVPPQRHLSQ